LLVQKTGWKVDLAGSGGHSGGVLGYPLMADKFDQNAFGVM